jgi:hypothetical protein
MARNLVKENEATIKAEVEKPATQEESFKVITTEQLVINNIGVLLETVTLLLQEVRELKEQQKEGFKKVGVES